MRRLKKLLLQGTFDADVEQNDCSGDGRNFEGAEGSGRADGRPSWMKEGFKVPADKFYWLAITNNVNLCAYVFIARRYSYKNVQKRVAVADSDYVPTVFDNFSANVVAEGITVNLGLWDTAVFLQISTMFWMSFLACVALTARISYAAVERQTYIVHMEDNVVAAMDESLGEGNRWYNAVLDSLHEDSGRENEPPQLLYVYQTAISGFSAKLSTKEVESLREIEGFLDVTPDEMLSLHTTHPPQFLGLKNGKGLWKAPNLAADVIGGVVDTGIWPEHVSFRDNGMSICFK